MPKVWFCLPSIRHGGGSIPLWKAKGYGVAVLRQGELLASVDIQIPVSDYLGWSRSTNILVREVLRRDPGCLVCAAGGDDYLPEPNHSPDGLAAEMVAHFNGTMFVCQFTGDRWGDSELTRKEFGEDRGAEIDRIAGSPWMGREWCERAYMGIGPMWPGYHHLYADEELHDVAIKLGVYWARRDLTQYHNHPCRTQGYDVYKTGHLAPLYDPERWAEERRHFEARKAKGFPGCEPCPR